MPKTKISEFDVDPANNTDINSINIAEGCAPSGINNAIRQLMSDLKEQLTGASGDPFTVGGAFAANGGATLGDASGDALTINSSAVSIPNGLNFDSNTFVIDATNNRVGVGTSSPLNRLHVVDNSTGTQLRVQSSSSNGTAIAIQNSATNGRNWRIGSNFVTGNGELSIYDDTSSVERMRIDSSGNVGIGTSSPNAKLDVQGGSISATGASSGSFGLSLLTTRASASARSWAIKTNENAEGDFVVLRSTTNTNAPSSTALMLDSSGNLIIGTTSVAQGLLTTLKKGSSGVIWGAGPDGGSGNVYYVLNSGGTGVGLTSGNTSWSAVSDERTKDIIEPIDNALNKVSTLRAVIGKYKTDDEGTRRSFLIAQDVQAVLPEVVDIASDEQGTMSIRYTEVIPLLVAAIKELKAEVDALKAQINQ